MAARFYSLTTETMPYHRFKTDQTVVPSTSDLPCGHYRVLRLLPSVHGELHYRIRSVADGHERTVLERQIRPLCSKGDRFALQPQPDAKPPALSALILEAEAAAASQPPDMLTVLITTLNAVISSAADPYLVSAALIEGVARTVVQKIPVMRQGEVSIEIVRLLRDRLRAHETI